MLISVSHTHYDYVIFLSIYHTYHNSGIMIFSFPFILLHYLQGIVWRKVPVSYAAVMIGGEVLRVMSIIVRLAAVIIIMGNVTGPESVTEISRWEKKPTVIVCGVLVSEFFCRI
jgi:hypothetical protein